MKLPLTWIMIRVQKLHYFKYKLEFDSSSESLGSYHQMFILLLILVWSDLSVATVRNAAIKTLAGRIGGSASVGGNNQQNLKNKPAGDIQLWKVSDPRIPIKSVLMKPIWTLSGSYLGNPNKIQLTGKPTEFEKKEIKDLLHSSTTDLLDYALGKAASWANEDSFEFLMSEKKDLLSSNGKNIALQMAAAHGNLKYFSQLLAEKDVNPAADNNLALYFSIFFNHKEIFDLLIESGRNVRQLTDEIYAEAKRPGREWFLQRILRDKRIQLPIVGSKSSADPLLVAIKQQNEENIKTFLDFGERTPLEYDTAFNTAVKTGNLSVVKLLLPTVDLDSNQNQAIKIAAIEGYTDIVKMLMPLSSYLEDALLVAAAVGNQKVVELLLTDQRVKIPRLALFISPPIIARRLRKEPAERFEPRNFVYNIKDEDF